MYSLTDLLSNPGLSSQGAMYKPTQYQTVMTQAPPAMQMQAPQQQESGQGAGAMGQQLGGLLGNLNKAPAIQGQAGLGVLKPEVLAQQAQAGPAMEMAGVNMGGLLQGLPGGMGGAAGAAGGAGVAAGAAGGPIGMGAMMAAPTLLKMFGGK
jgi:hypothetical protein